MKSCFKFLALLLAITATAQAQLAVLSPTNGVWRYLDDGSDQGTNWQKNSFNDSTWPAGTAPFGYGMTSITTTNASGRITYYFRRTFTAADPSAYANLVVRLRRDDGAVVYLNGSEVTRSNMPTSTIIFTTLASSSISGGNQFTYFSNNLAPSFLLAGGGVNQLAVELHEASANNVDAAFDLELLAQPVPCTPPGFTSTAQNQAACPGGSATFSVGASGNPVPSYQWYQNGTFIPGATSSNYTRSNIQPSDGGSYCVIISNPCGSQTNCATLTVSNCGPAITGISPTTAQMGDLITITGSGFDPVRANNCVVLKNGARVIPMRVVQASSNQLLVLVGPVPPDAQPGQIAVATGQGAENAVIDTTGCVTCPPPRIRIPWLGIPGEPGPQGVFCSLILQPESLRLMPTGRVEGAEISLPPQSTLPWDPLPPVWTFSSSATPLMSSQQISLIPTPAPPKGTNWIFSQPASNGGVTFVISNDCPALTEVQIQGDLSVASTPGFGLDIIIPKLILTARLPAAACAQAICDLLKNAYAQVGITINCTVTPLGGNAASITITAPGGSITAAGVTICFSPAANQPPAVITSIDPLSATTGDMVTIEGSGFGNNPDNVCLQVMNPGRTIPLRVLEAQDDRIIAELGFVPPNAQPGQIGLSLGIGMPRSITDRSNIIVSPQPAWGFAGTQPGVLSPQVIAVNPPPPPPPPPTNQPIKKEFYSLPVDSNGVICVFVDSNCVPGTKITIEAHFDLMDSDPNDGIDCPITHIDSWLNGSLSQSSVFTGSGTDGNCVDFVCQFFAQLFYNSYNTQFGNCFGYPVSCSADLATGKITITASPGCGCKLINGGVTVQYCIPPQSGTSTPVITDVSPTTFQSGQVIQVSGTGFGNNPDDLCMVIVNQGRLIPLRALTATDTQLTAEVGPIPPDAQPGPIGIGRGDGSTGMFQPAWGDLRVEPAWFFDTTNVGTASPLTVNPTYVPPVNQTWYHSFLSNGQVYVFLPGPCPPGTKLIMDGHFDIHATNSPIRHADCWLPAVNYYQGGSALDCARRICDSFACGFLQRTGVRLNCKVFPQGGGALICLGYPNGTIVNGGMTVCVRICNQPPVAPCVTNTVYVFSHGTTNDNFVGPEAASPRPELVSWLSSVGIASTRTYDDAVSANKPFADSFNNLPDCITKATLRIRLRANPDIPNNDSITLLFAGAGGVLDPMRWTSYIGTGNPGPSVANVAWVNGAVAEVVLDLSRLPLGNNQFKDLLPTLCAKKYLDIYVQDDTSVDYAVLTLESCRCRQDIFVCRQPGANCAVVTYATPVFSDLCCPNPALGNTLKVSCSPASGTCFPIGTNFVKCTAEDAAGRRTRCCFRVIVSPNNPPFLITQPIDQTVPLGSNATFSVTAAGGSLTYQWYFNGAAIGGATSNLFSRNPVSAADVGNYYVIVANGCGSVTSTVARLRIRGCCTNSMVAGLNLIGCPYEIGGNTLNEIMPGIPGGSTIYIFDNASQTWQVAFFNGASWVPNLTLLPGEGAFLKTPVAFPLVLCGARRTQILTNNIPPGKCYLLSLQTDGVGTYNNIVGQAPTGGEQVYLFHGGYTAYFFDDIDLAWSPTDPILPPCTAGWFCPNGGSIPQLPQQPNISSVSPSTVQAGCLITITGSGFDPNPDNVCAVLMNGPQVIPLHVVQASPTQLLVRLNGLPPGTPVIGQLAVANGQGTQLGIVDPIDGQHDDFIDARPDDGALGYVGPCDADGASQTDIGPTAPWPLLQAAWVFRTVSPAVLSPGTITLVPPPVPGKGTNWVFAQSASNCAVSFVISNDCPALTKVSIQGDLSVTGPDALGLDIIIPNLIINTRLPAVKCAQSICDLLKKAYAQVGITIECVVTPIGANAAQITIDVPGGCINGAGVMLCFSPAEAGRPDPIITAIDPISGGPGTIVTITGRGFGNNPDDVCVQIMNGPRTIWMRALTAEDDRVTAEVGSVPADAVPGPIGLVRGFGHGQMIMDPSNIVVNPIPAWNFASTKPGVRSTDLFTPIHPDDPPPPPPGQPIKKRFISQAVNSNGLMCIFLDPNCDPNTKISIHGHFDLMDIDPNDGIDCPLTHIDTAIDGTWWHSQVFTGSGLGGDCVDFVCQYLVQIFYDEYNSQFGQCFGYPVSCSADRATGKITINAECGCKLISGVVEVEYCIPPAGGLPDPVITDVVPSTFTSGQTIFIMGANFHQNMPDDHCLVVVNQGRLIPLRALAATDTMLTVEVGPVPPDAQPGPIGLALGDGSTATFRPAFFDIFPEPAWFFSTTNPGTASPVIATPTYTPPPPQQTWYHSFLSNGQVYVFLPGPCPPGTKLIMDGHFDIQATNSPIRHADCWLPAVSYLTGGSAVDCARRICDSFVCGFLQRTGVRLNCQVIPAGNGALVCVGYPNGTIVNGGMTVCTRICDQPPVAPCATNTVYVFSHGTTNDNFVGPQAASPRPEFVTYLSGVGITTLRGYDDANTVVNQYFADSFANLPDCITKATLRIRLRANHDIEVNDAILLAFAGAGGVLDPDRWSAYIGSGNAGVSVLNTQWISPSVAELVLDLSRLPLGGNMYKDLIPTLCAKRYLDIGVQDDTSVDYAILTVESCRCRADLVVCARPGANCGVAMFATPVFTDLCCPNAAASSLSVSCVPASGSCFPLGTNLVHCTAVDAAGRRARCCFRVIVVPATPPAVCSNPTMISYIIGTTNDNFTGPEPASPSAGQLKRLRMAGISCFKGFDDCTVNCYFAHTFSNLPPCIVSATLDIRLRACGDICVNDGIGLSFSSPSGALLPGGWGRYLGNGNAGGVGLFNVLWSAGTTREIVLDLSALPNVSGAPTDLIPALNANGFLDLGFQDDSAIDFAILTIKSCCCQQDIFVNTSPNQCCAVVNYNPPPFTNNCPGPINVVCTPPSGFCFPVGVNLVECRATDPFQDVGRCFFKVTVRDAVPPVILNCPTNVIACVNGTNNVGVMPDLITQVIATDNCTPSSQLIITQNPPPGSIVNGGVVTFTVTDGAGNSTMCTSPIFVQPCCIPPPPSLVLWLTFDELAGLTAINSAGGNNGTLVNGPTRGAGYDGRALCFDGIDDTVVVPNYPAINAGTNDLSIDAWVLRDPNSGNPVRVIVDKRDTFGIGYSLSVSFGNMVFQLADSSGFTNYRDTGVVPADNQWHFLAVTVCRHLTNGGRFYIDGVAQSTFDPTGHLGDLNNSGAFRVGSSIVAGNIPWLGCIDEVEVFRRCLSTAEITSLYNARFKGKCKTRCLVPWDTLVWGGRTSVVINATVCNPSAVAQTYDFTFQGLPPGAGCNYPGPTVFSPASGTTVVPAGGCASFPVTITAPPGMPCNALACYQMIVIPKGTTERFACEGSLFNSCTICAQPPTTRTNLIDCRVTSVGTWTLNNTTLMPIDLTGTRFSAWGPDMMPDLRVISLNGLPPGVPWEVPPGLILPPSGGPGGFAPAAGGVDLPLTVQFMGFDPGQSYTILLEADTDGDGQFEPLGSMEVENTSLSATLTIVHNANGSVTVSWPANEGWTLQEATDPRGTWGPSAVQNGVPFTLGGTPPKRYFRLQQ